MEDPDHSKLEDEFRREIFRTFHSTLSYWAAALTIATAWSFYFLKTRLGFDFIEFVHGEPRDPRDHFDSSISYLVVAIVITVIMVPWAIYKARKVKGLLVNGLQTTGTVISWGIASKYGMVPAMIVYKVDGKEYKSRKDMLASEYPVGTTVRILYDPANPEKYATI